MKLLSQSTTTKAIGILGTCVLVVAIGLHILCMATPYYFVLSDGDAKEVFAGINFKNLSNNVTLGIQYGLWRICVDGGNESYQDQCYQIGNNDSVASPDWLTAPRTLSILGLLVAAAGVASLIAFLLVPMDRFPYFFLAAAAVSCIVGGIIILSGDIAFAAERTIKFYADRPKDRYFFNQTDTAPDKAWKIQQYDSRFTNSWSFILDLISGAFCIAAGPLFVYVALRLQWEALVKNKHSVDGVLQSNQISSRV